MHRIVGQIGADLAANGFIGETVRRGQRAVLATVVVRGGSAGHEQKAKQGEDAGELNLGHDAPRPVQGPFRSRWNSKRAKLLPSALPQGNPIDRECAASAVHWSGRADQKRRAGRILAGLEIPFVAHCRMRCQAM